MFISNSKKSPLWHYLYLMTVIIFLTSCSAIDIQSYKDKTPLFIPEEFFDGELKAHGILKNRSGKVIRTFKANISAYWKKNIGTLEEDFIFDDGEHQRRVWTLTPHGNGQYIGTANDVVGDAIINIAGNTMFLNYTLTIPYNNRELNVYIDDKMYLVSNTTLINESRITKFGFHVGTIILSITKLHESND